MINLGEGLVLIGPGSEWFWSAFSGIVVAVTLLALYRQLRLQTGQKMMQDVAALDAEWDSERMLRHRLVLAIALRDGTPIEELPVGQRAPFAAVANFWEEVAFLTRGKYLDKQLVAEQMGPWMGGSWSALEPFIQRMRQEHYESAFADFEWLIHEMVRIAPDLAWDLERHPERHAGMVEALEGLIAVEVQLRH